MPDGFVANHDLLREDCRIDDLLEFDSIVQSFSLRLKSVPPTTMLGLVGEYGSGKSTMLFQLQQASPKSELWINFDAWKYPERHGLWEGFVLDFADQLGKKRQVAHEVDGRTTGIKSIDGIANIVRTIVDRTPFLAKIEKATEFFSKSPAKRTFEIQEMLSQLIKGVESDIVIVIEDIDRSGDCGVYFLETMHQFLSELRSDKRLVVIVPIGNENFGRRRHTYDKCLDFVEIFEPRYNFSLFVDAIFDKSLFEVNASDNDQTSSDGNSGARGQMIDFFEDLTTKTGINIRVIKSLLRRSNLVYVQQKADGYKPDWRLTIGFEAAKHLGISDGATPSLFDDIRSSGKVRPESSLAALLLAVASNCSSLFEQSKSTVYPKKLIYPPVPFNLIPAKRDQPFQAWSYSKEHAMGSHDSLGVCDLYMNY